MFCITFYSIVSEFSTDRSKKQVQEYMRRKYLASPRKKGRFTREEDEVIMEFIYLFFIYYYYFYFNFSVEKEKS
jgi:hypothetical protein